MQETPFSSGRGAVITALAGAVAASARKRKRVEHEVVMDAMWQHIDAKQGEKPERFRSDLKKSKKQKPFVNHQARYKKLARAKA
jgi:hypothetical protein